MTNKKNAVEATDLELYRRLLTYIKPYLGYFALSVLGYIIYAVSNTATAAAMEFIIDAIAERSEKLRMLLPLLLVGVFLLRGLGSFLGTYYIEIVGTRVVHSLRCELFDKMIWLPCSYFDQSSTGHLISRITFNTEQVIKACTKSITVVIREGLIVIGLLGYMIYMNWKLTAIFLILAPFIALAVAVAGKKFKRISKRIQRSAGDVTHISSEAINSYRVVRTFGGETYESDRFLKASQYNTRQRLKMAKTDALYQPAVQSLVACSLGIIIWLALSPAVMEDMTPGQFVAFITAAAMVGKPIKQLTSVSSSIQRALAAASDMFIQIDEPLEPDTGELTLEQAEGHIEFRNVDFRYGKGQDLVLKKLSLDIQPGQTVAFVGRSGSGKSTVASLIPRFYPPTAGEVLLDGNPVESYRLKNLRSQIALVNQNVTLFNDTIANNVAYGDLRGTPDEAIMEAIRMANAEEFVSKMPQGIHTLIGDNGTLLSGGQRQRLALARAILKDAPILILDEATSALDTESERFIQEALETVMEGRTTIVIAHRLSTIENADKIVVMDSGQIVEQGTHQELLALGGDYANLHKIQFSEAN